MTRQTANPIIPVMIKINARVPDFSLPATANKTFKLSEHKGYNIILYFYPKDNTPGCTRESQDFRDKVRSFSYFKTRIFGISRDSITSHEKFKTQQKLPFLLLSDSDEKLCKLFDVIKMKNMYGKKVRGIERSTFLIDKKGFLRHAWRKVKVDGHVAEVLAAVKSL